VTKTQKVSFQIFDINGRLIKTLLDEEMQQGSHQLTWNAKDEKGKIVSGGIYFLKMQRGNYSETKKLIVEK
jgi:flagellar hook assembly protein FlgD